MGTYKKCLKNIKFGKGFHQTCDAQLLYRYSAKIEKENPKVIRQHHYSGYETNNKTHQIIHQQK